VTASEEDVNYIIQNRSLTRGNAKFVTGCHSRKRTYLTSKPRE